MSMHSCGQLKLLSLQYFCEIDIEEVDVQPRLDETSSNGNRIDDAIREIPVNPIRDVERPVNSKRCQVMCRDCLCFPRPLKHEELGKNGDGFEEDGERPQNLGQGELVVKDERKNKAGADEVFDLEGINGGVVRGAVFVFHDIEGVASTRDEEQLHNGVVKGNIAVQKVQIPRCEDENIECLCLE